MSVMFRSTSSPRRPAPTRWPVGALAAAVLLAACGTRLSDNAFELSTETILVEDGEAVVNPATGEVIVPAPTGGRDAGTDLGPDGTPAPGTPAPGAPATGTPTPVTGPGQAGGSPAQANQASDVGITENLIRIGNITAENGVLGDTFAPAVRGLRAWVEHTNANGGIGGRRVQLFTCDDREDRSRSLECARRLVEQDQVFALVATNSRALGGAAQYLADRDIPVLGFPITNSFFRYPNFFSVYGTGYPRDGSTVGIGGQITNLSGVFRWLGDNLGVTKAAVFNYDIAESAQAGNAQVAQLRAEGFEVTQYSVSFAAPSFDQAVADMQRRGTELVVDSMDDGANRRLCDSMARRQFVPKGKVSTVVAMGAAVGANYNETCRNVIFIPTESLAYTVAHPEVRTFRDAYARYQPGLPLHQWALEAWAMGNITADAMAAMGATPTRAGYIDFLDRMEANDAKGIMVGTDFRPGSYSYTTPTSRDCFGVARWLDDRGGWVMASDPFPFCYDDARNVTTAAQEQGN